MGNKVAFGYSKAKSFIREHEVEYINKNAMNGTILAHTDGNVPNLMVHIPE